MARNRRALIRAAKAARRAGRFIVVSNRLPFSFQRGMDGRWRAEPASGGLVTALLPVLRNRGGTWVGWPGAPGPLSEFAGALKSSSHEAGYHLVGVPLSEDEVRDFYLGFSNEIVWPLFHDLLPFCNFNASYWRTYCKVNRRYARAVHALADSGSLVWVHDYHLMNVAAEMRLLGSRARLGFYLHIPFPSPDIFVKLPWRWPLLQALLKYDLLGFQTARDRRNFLACVQAVQPKAGQATRTGHFPISIDFNAFMRRAAAPDVAAKAQELHRLLPNRKLVLGIDRLDYTKGIPLRLAAFQHLLARYPEMRGRVSLMQVVVPSRESIPQYHQLRTEIEQMVGKINGAYARPGGWVPIWYEYRNLSRTELLAYYRAADIALVTPLKDGMNLVAKEYCACSIEEDCVLILSEFAGAAAQLAPDAMLVNPYDIEGVAETIREAYAMPAAERAARMRRIRRSIRREDVFWWVDSYLRAAITKDLRAFPRAEVEVGELPELQLPL
jgi:trehalose 6-phosphate synthase/phosphatase